MIESLYSQNKVAHHPEVLEALRQGERPKAPVHVQLILSDLCNQDCGFCAYRMSSGLSHELFVGESPVAKIGHNNPQRMIPTAKALEIIDDCAELGVKAIQFTGGGEPTVQPDHLALFRRAQDHGIQTGLVTNGVKLTPEDPGILRMTWIRVSVDAGDEFTYAKVRRVPVGHWDKVWRNIGTLNALGFKGVLGVGFVVTPENYTGIAEAAKLAKQHGASYMRVGAVFSAEGLDFYNAASNLGVEGESLMAAIDRTVAEAKAEVDDAGFQIVDLFTRRTHDLAFGRPTDPECYYMKVTVYIGGDLNVYRCCNVAYTKAGLVGSLRDQRFKDAWPLLGYDPFDARGCQFCQFLGQNRAIAALVREPTHVNFV